MATTKAKTGNIVDFDAAKLTGSLGNLDGSQLTNIRTIIKQSGNPSTSTNPTGGVGTMYVNTSNGATFCCTDSTTNANIWMNVGEGSGNIIQPTNPNDNFPDMQENTTVSHTFTGSTDDDNVVSHVISDISSDKLTVNDALVADGQPHVFNAGDVDADLNVTFIVKTIDNDGLYSTGTTITVTIHNDEIPVAPADNGSFPDLNKNETYNHVFTGGTDDNGVTHYLVENISDAAVTVTNAEVAATNAHSFVTTNVGADTPFTFTLKAKDTVGQYSTPVTYTSQVLATVYTTATGGVVNAGTVSGNYTYHQFNSTGNFTVSQVGDDATIEYIVIAGGGDGGGASYASGAGGGGAGGYRSSVVGEQSGGGVSAESKPTIQIGQYTATIGAGGAGVGNGGQKSGVASSFSGPGISTITTDGGGYGIGYGSPNGSAARAANGGSGGGCSWHNSAPTNSASGDGWGLGTYGQGYHGGNAPQEASAGGGGGGAAAVGQTSPADNNTAGDGGAGIASSITGASVARAGGGGGGVCHYGPYGTSASGQNPGTSSFGGGTGGTYATPQAGHGTQNTGAGGGGGQASNSSQDQGGTGQGGSGVVIVRYRSS